MFKNKPNKKTFKTKIQNVWRLTFFLTPFFWLLEIWFLIFWILTHNSTHRTRTEWVTLKQNAQRSTRHLCRVFNVLNKNGKQSLWFSFFVREVWIRLCYRLLSIFFQLKIIWTVHSSVLPSNDQTLNSNEYGWWWLRSAGKDIQKQSHSKYSMIFIVFHRMERNVKHIERKKTAHTFDSSAFHM